jgi:voltage-gated potassium channel
MVLTTLGSEAWPKSPEGRILGFLLSIYAFTVFGYVTATLATYFIGKDKEEASPAATAEVIRNLQSEIEALRRDLSEINKK